MPSRISSREISLDRAPSARRPAQPAPVSPPPTQPPRRRRGPGFPFVRVAVVLLLLAAAAAGVKWLLRDRQGEEPVAAASAGSAQPGEGGLSEVPDELRPVIEYLRPSTAEIRLWLDSVLASSYVRSKWNELAQDIGLSYGPDVDKVNAFAFYDDEEAGRPSIAICGGMVRLSRLVGALSLLQSSAEAQGVDKDVKAYLRRISDVVAETGELSEETVIHLLDEFDVGTEVFQNVGAVSNAKGIADGVCKCTLAHEFGHLAGGHPRGADLNRTVSQNEERQADLFASSIAASVANGQQMLGGQILTWYTFALAETINPTNEIFRSHPYAVDRLRSAIDSNKSLAVSLGITSADVDQLVAEISGKEAGAPTEQTAASDDNGPESTD